MIRLALEEKHKRLRKKCKKSVKKTWIFVGYFLDFAGKML
nr:MAG TPA: hypothetical protein [Caudoviricetes sp.]